MKKHLKSIIGVAVIVLVAVIFFLMQSGASLENGTLKQWISASDSRRNAAAEILVGGNGDTKLIEECITKMSTLPGSGNTKVSDAAALCVMGTQIKENI